MTPSRAEVAAPRFGGGPSISGASDRVLVGGAYVVGAICIGMLGTFLACAAADGEAVAAALQLADWREEVPFVVEMTVGGVIGALLAVRLPRHPAGWLLGILSIGFLAFDVVVAVVAVAGASPTLGVRLIAWAGNWVWVLGHVGAFFLLLLLPTGRPLSPRWAVLGRVAACVLASLLVTLALMPGPLEATPELSNPVGVGFLASFGEETIGLLIATVLILELLAALSFVLRFVRSRGVERVQLKWITVGVVILVAAQVGELVGLVPRMLAPIGGLALNGALLVAITRYRLYDIDRLVTRTVSYGAVTAVLVGVYAGAVVTIRALSAPLAGGSDVAVVGSTLLVATLFGPVRRRVQTVVDRRFDRQRYDAARAVSRFGTTVRDEVDLEEVATALRRTVVETLHPASVTLWVPEPGEGS